MQVMFVYPGFENVGIEYLSAVLQKDGFQTQLAFDPQLFNDPFLKASPLDSFFSCKDAILKQIKEFNPGLIAFSVISANYLWALDLGRSLRAGKIDYAINNVWFKSEGRIVTNPVRNSIINKCLLINGAILLLPEEGA